MSDGTGIEWTHRPGTRGETWNPVVGCSIKSPGCANCYAMRMAARLEAIGVQHYAGTTIASKAGAVWTGKIAAAPEHIMLAPLSWRAPRTIFVNSMGDLFHEDVPDVLIDRVFGVAALCPRHTFIVLTKRSDRMRRYMTHGGPTLQQMAEVPQIGRGVMVANTDWPLPNVWLGVSAERQQEADERIPDLMATPAAVRFLSAEPLLGEIDLLGTLARWQDTPGRRCAVPLGEQLINWVIVGGESGPRARPMHPAWARALRDQCTAAGVPFFFKQWGSWQPWAPETTILLRADGFQGHIENIEDWPDDAVPVARVGKPRAGRLLDGVEHNAFPEV